MTATSIAPTPIVSIAAMGPFSFASRATDSPSQVTIAPRKTLPVESSPAIPTTVARSTHPGALTIASPLLLVVLLMPIVVRTSVRARRAVKPVRRVTRVARPAKPPRYLVRTASTTTATAQSIAMIPIAPANRPVRLLFAMATEYAIRRRLQHLLHGLCRRTKG